MSSSKAKPKILILNSDSPNNRGDRAILQGIITLIREVWEGAEITTLSEHATRDSNWYNVEFLNISANTVNPFHMLKIILQARKSDYVMWGGGEILKDYTNKLNPIYWTLRIIPVLLVNKNIIGVYQGIGPTKGWFSKKLIKILVNSTRVFIVRDRESKEKLLSWGVDTLILTSYDPAVLNEAREIDASTLKKTDVFNIDIRFLNNCIGVGPRKWFHYKKSGVIPFKFRFWEKNKQLQNEELDNYVENFSSLCNWIIQEYGVNLIFFPMYMTDSENDAGFSKTIIKKIKRQDKVRIIDEDIMSPEEYNDLLGSCRAFISMRMHPSILATSSFIPTMVFYYVDKGRLYFEQIGMREFSQPIEELGRYDEISQYQKKFVELIKNEREIRGKLKVQINKLREDIRKTFTEAIKELDRYE